MGEIILVIIAVVLAANGRYTLCWILIGVAVLAGLASLFSKGKPKAAPGERPRTRIDIPHYYEPDEYVCTICGTRFHSDTMTCPHCGVRFNQIRTDEDSFIEEEEIEEWMDEMDEDDR